MPILKSLTFTNLPVRSHDPVANRRAKLVSRLEEQRQLAQNLTYVREWTDMYDAEGRVRSVVHLHAAVALATTRGRASCADNYPHRTRQGGE
jgi:DNA-binding MarR family transcriptional regulator